MNGARESGRRVQCVNNLRQFGVALTAYHDDHGAFPVGNSAPTNYPYSYVGGWWGFQAHLLPYLEAKNVGDLCNFSYQGDCFSWIGQQPQGMNPAVMIPPCSKCPDDPLKDEVYDCGFFGNYGCTNYLGVMGTSSNRERRHPPSRRPQQRHQSKPGHGRGLAHDHHG